MINQNLTELNKLEEWLNNFVKDHTEYTYERHDRESSIVPNWHQIVVYNKYHKVFDAVCHFGSYGYSQGLLEIMGDIVTETEDKVVGWLTSQDVIDRFVCWIGDTKDETN